MGLPEFALACKKVDSRLEIGSIDNVVCAYIGGKSVAIEGYNFPYQAFLITNLMNECGAFE